VSNTPVWVVASTATATVTGAAGICPWCVDLSNITRPSVTTFAVGEQNQTGGNVTVNATMDGDLASCTNSMATDSGSFANMIVASPHAVGSASGRSEGSSFTDTISPGLDLVPNVWSQTFQMEPAFGSRGVGLSAPVSLEPLGAGYPAPVVHKEADAGTLRLDGTADSGVATWSTPSLSMTIGDALIGHAAPDCPATTLTIGGSAAGCGHDPNINVCASGNVLITSFSGTDSNSLTLDGSTCALENGNALLAPLQSNSFVFSGDIGPGTTIVGSSVASILIGGASEAGSTDTLTGRTLSFTSGTGAFSANDLDPVVGHNVVVTDAVTCDQGQSYIWSNASNFGAMPCTATSTDTTTIAGTIPTSKTTAVDLVDTAELTAAEGNRVISRAAGLGVLLGRTVTRGIDSMVLPNFSLHQLTQVSPMLAPGFQGLDYLVAKAALSNYK
jgi:hypothetical protein